jgi:hypothetical protein
LWYVGTLQAENGQDLQVDVPGDAPLGAATEPVVVKRPNRHPDDADAA